MSHFYGTLNGSRGPATRCGTKSSGLCTIAAGWQGCIRVYISHDPDTDTDHAEVTLEPWERSGGRTRVLYSGPLDATLPPTPAQEADTYLCGTCGEWGHTACECPRQPRRIVPGDLVRWNDPDGPSQLLVVEHVTFRPDGDGTICIITPDGSAYEGPSREFIPQRPIP